MRLIRDGQRGPAHRRGDGHAEHPHRQLYGAYGRVAGRAEGQEKEDAPVQLRRPLKVTLPRGLYQIHEQLGGDVGEGADGAVGPGDHGGQYQGLEPRQDREVGSHGFDLLQHLHRMGVLGGGVLDSSHVRVLGGYPRDQRGREVCVDEQGKVVDENRDIDRLGHCRKVPEERLLAHRPVER